MPNDSNKLFIVLIIFLYCSSYLGDMNWHWKIENVLPIYIAGLVKSSSGYESYSFVGSRKNMMGFTQMQPIFYHGSMIFFLTKT